MMTDKLREVIAEAEKLSSTEQDALAETLRIMLDERGWDARFADPGHQEMMRRMGEEALKEHAAGQTEEWP